MNQAIKVELVWTDYVRRGLRLASGLVPEDGEAVIFDRNLDFTRHRVVSRTDKYVVLSGAIPWPKRRDVQKRDTA